MSDFKIYESLVLFQSFLCLERILIIKHAEGTERDSLGRNSVHYNARRISQTDAAKRCAFLLFISLIDCAIIMINCCTSSLTIPTEWD